MKEFKVNDYLNLKVKEGRTVIYIKDRRIFDYPFPSEENFLEYCKAIKTWADQNYDTTLLAERPMMSILHWLAYQNDPIGKKKLGGIFSEKMDKNDLEGLNSLLNASHGDNLEKEFKIKIYKWLESNNELREFIKNSLNNKDFHKNNPNSYKKYPFYLISLGLQIGIHGKDNFFINDIIENVNHDNLIFFEYLVKELFIFDFPEEFIENIIFSKENYFINKIDDFIINKFELENDQDFYEFLKEEFELDYMEPLILKLKINGFFTDEIKDTDIFKGIFHIDWDLYDHAYGSSTDVPQLLEELASDIEIVRDHAMNMLYTNVYHQESVSEAALPVIFFLFNLLEEKTILKRHEIIEYLMNLALSNSEYYLQSFYSYDDGLDYMMVPQDIYDEVNLQLPRLYKLFQDDDELVRYYLVNAFAFFEEHAIKSAPYIREIIKKERKPIFIANAIISLGILDHYNKDKSDDYLFEEFIKETHPLIIRQAASIARITADRSSIPSYIIDFLKESLLIEEEKRNTSIKDNIPFLWYGDIRVFIEEVLRLIKNKT
ncbi:MAG: hypothetical protein ACFFAS_13600 [Promethearchaeota archaeon]